MDLVSEINIYIYNTYHTQLAEGGGGGKARGFVSGLEICIEMPCALLEGLAGMPSEITFKMVQIDIFGVYNNNNNNIF